MEYSREYGEAFMALSEKMGAAYPETPYHAIEEWESLIEQMVNGYSSVQPELEYDLELIREPIETFLVDPNLSNLHDHEEFKKRIEALDKKFLEISIEQPDRKRSKDFRWWSNRVLKYGSKDYAEFINAHLGKYWGIVVETI